MSGEIDIIVELGGRIKVLETDIEKERAQARLLHKRIALLEQCLKQIHGIAWKQEPLKEVDE